MLSKISDIVEKQRCSVLALSTMGGTLSVFWSDTVIVFKTENALWNAIEKAWHLQKGQCKCKPAFSVNKASLKKTN